MTHLHLDPLGGIAGDMFAAALLHARPDLEGDVARTVHAATGVAIAVRPASDGALHGRGFTVGAAHAHGHHDHDGAHHDHDHVHWDAIRRRLNDGRLEPRIAERATAIFTLLAAAEGRIHGVAADAVTFHEVGAVDSIGDIVAAATLLERLDVTTASTAAVPLGAGRVETAHGIMPVPAPATAFLLEGLPTVQDGIAGERTTPTGAAILRHLAPATIAPAGTLLASGYGFGTRRLPGIANCLRVLLLAPADAAVPHRRLAVITFEIDDQTGEDLATGIGRLRATPGIHDVVQIPAIGKKGRFAVQVQVLADAAQAEVATEACFRETATIGLRIAAVDARTLHRRIDTVATDAGPVRVKLAERPGGTTAKAESDDLGAHDAAARARLREVAGRTALGGEAS